MRPGDTRSIGVGELSKEPHPNDPTRGRTKSRLTMFERREPTEE